MNLSKHTDQNIKTDQPGAPIDCRTARRLLDRRDRQTGPDSELLKAHLAICANCATEAAVEDALREIIAPATLPSVSSSFEANLMAQLDLKPHPSIAVQKIDNPVTLWGWVVAVLTTGVLVIANLNFIIDTISKVSSLVYAKAAGMFAGKTVVLVDNFFGTIPAGPGFIENLMLNMVLGMLVLTGGLFAIGWVRKV